MGLERPGSSLSATFRMQNLRKEIDFGRFEQVIAFWFASHVLLCKLSPWLPHPEMRPAPATLSVTPGNHKQIYSPSIHLCWIFYSFSGEWFNVLPLPISVDIMNPCIYPQFLNDLITDLSLLTFVACRQMQCIYSFPI